MSIQSRKLFFPKQFGPYDDDIDPNSVIKYRPKLKTVEHFNTFYSPFDNINILLSLFIVLILVQLYSHTID
jgi:hypothetical protein